MSIDIPHTTEEMQASARNLERASNGERDPEDMKLALKELTRAREELRQRIGTVNIAVELIRDARNP